MPHTTIMGASRHSFAYLYTLKGLQVSFIARTAIILLWPCHLRDFAEIVVRVIVFRCWYFSKRYHTINPDDRVLFAGANDVQNLGGECFLSKITNIWFHIRICLSPFHHDAPTTHHPTTLHIYPALASLCYPPFAGSAWS
jgi:hypothetical protein